MNPQQEEGFFSSRKNAMVAGMWGIAFTTLFLSIFLVAQTIKTFEKDNTHPSTTITIVGEGEIVVIPDIATFNYTVNEVAEDVDSAQQLATEKSNRILGLLSEKEITEKDIKTISYNINPKYEWRQPYCPPGQPCRAGQNVLIGYEVSHTVQVKIRDMEKAGEIISIIGSSNVSNVGNLSFQIDDQETVLSEVRNKAIENAMAKSEELAEQLGVKIKKVVSFNEDYRYDYPMGYGGMEMRADMMMKDQAVTPEIPAGENIVKTRVYITFEIKG